MIPRWDDVNARARGLATRLLPVAAVRALAAARDLGGFAEQLARHGYAVAELGPGLSLETLDRLIGHTAAARQRLLARRAGPRRRRVRALFEAADRAALRAIIRGVADGAAPSRIRAGISPGVTLPGSMVEALCQAPSLAAVGEELSRVNHPYACVFTPRPAKSAPVGELLALELALRRCHAERVREGARRGGKAVRRLAAETIDLENLRALLLTDAWGVELGVEELFIGGGRILFRDRFTAIAAQEDAEARRVSLARAFRGTAAGPVLQDPGLAAVGLDAALLQARLRAAHRASRTDPLSVWVLAWVMLRIEAEAHDLRRVLRGHSLGAPAALVGGALVTDP